MATYEEDLLAMAQAILGGPAGIAGLTFNEAMKAMAAEIVLNGVGGGGGGASLASLLETPKVGSYIGPTAANNNGATGPFLSGTQEPSKIVVPKQITIDQIGINVDTAQATINAKALLYASDADGHPATLVAQTGALDCATTGNKLGDITPVVLPAGIYWGAIRSSTGATTVRFRGQGQTFLSALQGGGAFNSLTAPPQAVQIDAGTYDAPAATIASWTYSFSASGNIHPFLGLRRSA